MFGVVNPSFAQAASAKKVGGHPEQNPAIKQRLTICRTRAPVQAVISNIDRDVAPWIGTEVGFMLMDAPATSTQAAPRRRPASVVMVATRDTAKSNAALASACGRAPSPGEHTAERRNVSGRDHREPEGALAVHRARQTRSAYATYQSTVLLADSTDALKKALDTKKAGSTSNLAGSAVYKSIVDKLPKDHAMMVVADLRALAQSASSSHARPRCGHRERGHGRGTFARIHRRRRQPASTACCMT